MTPHAYLGVYCPPNARTVRLFDETCGLTTAMAAISFIGALLTLITGWTWGFGMMSGLILPLLGFTALTFRSTVAVRTFAILCGATALANLVVWIVYTSIAGDMVSCICSEHCALSLGAAYNSYWVCTHKTSARVGYYLAVFLGMLMTALQFAACGSAMNLSFDNEFFIAEVPMRANLLPPGSSPTFDAASYDEAPGKPRRPSGYTYAARPVGASGA